MLDRLQVVVVVVVVVVNIVVVDVVAVVVVDLHGFRGLNYVSLAMVSCATCVSFFLPSVQSAIYFHRQVSHVYHTEGISPEGGPRSSRFCYHRQVI